MLSGHTLFARADNAGDVLLSGPAVRAVARSARRLTYLCGPSGAAAARLLPGVDAVVTERLPWIDPDPQPATPADLSELVGRLARLEVSDAVISTSFHQSPLPLAMALRMAGVSRIAAISSDYAGSLLDVRVVVEDDLHEVKRSITLVNAAGYRLDPADDLRLQIRPTTKTLPRELEQVPLPYVVLHPGSSVPARAWSEESMRSLCALLVEEDWGVVVTGSSAERALTAQVCADARSKARAGQVADLGGRTDLPSLATVISQAAVIVVGNTGPAHLAAAMGTPVVSIYAPTVPAIRWHPWMVPTVILGAQDIACAGCRARTCPVSGHPCVDDVSPASALEAIESLVKGQRAHELQGVRS